MASDPGLALQGALVAALKAAATGAGNNVYDQVPSSNPFPRITVGDAQNVNNSADCYDGTESFLEVNVWSRETGYPETKTIASQVRAALHRAQLSLVGHTLELLEFRDVVYRRDPDGVTRHAIMSFRALTQPSD